MQDTPYKVKTQHEHKSSDVVWHEQGVSHHFRSQAKGHAPCVLWFTGLSGSGKSTIANAVDLLLHDMGAHAYVLDGDNVRHGLNGDLGFSEQDRAENIRRLGEVANLFVDAGLIVLTAFISPFQADRSQARAKINRGRFIEVFIDTPLEICEARDPKGLYQKARRGEIKHFTGIDSVYEAPVNPELHIKTAQIDSSTCAEIIVNYLIEQRILQPS